jgi:hypothetical protein
MKNQEKQSLLSQLIAFIFKIVREQIPTKKEFKEHLTKGIFKALFLILCILFSLLLAGIIKYFYLLGFFLKILSNIFLFGAAADSIHNRRQDTYFGENERYY